MTIDKNGDRHPDYSLMDMDPVTGEFKVRYYEGANTDFEFGEFSFKMITPFLNLTLHCVSRGVF